MDSNTHSAPPGPRRPDGLATVAAGIEQLATEDLDRLPDAVVAEQVLTLRRLLDRLDGQWLQRLATVDGRGAAGAEDGTEIGSTAAWLRGRLLLGGGAASGFVQTARALFRGPLAATGEAVCAGEVSVAHAQVLAHGTRQLPNHVAAEAEPTLLDAARRLDPTRLRHAVDHLVSVADPDGAGAARERRHQRRGLWLTPTFDDMVAVDGLLEPEAGQLVVAALEPLARPSDAGDIRTGSQRNADALTELARRHLESGQLPKVGGVRPRLAVVVDLDSLVSCPGALDGKTGWAGTLDPEACRRLACDAAVTRVMVSRQPSNRGHQASDGDHPSGQLYQDHHPGHGASVDGSPSACGHLSSNQDQGLEGRLRAAMVLLPPTLGGAPSQPLNVGRTSRVISPAQRTALAARDGGCVFPDCARPLAWCEGHHLVSWLYGGPTDLANLALLCRAHHRAVHEGGWRLQRDPHGRFTATPPHRRPRAAA
jgi:hypothetical protein